MNKTFRERLDEAITRIGKTKAEQAKALGYTPRQLENWRKGEGLVNTLEKFEQAGLLHLNDGSCTCSAKSSSH